MSHNAIAQNDATKIDRDAFYSLCNKSFPKYLFKDQARKTFDGIFDYWETTQYEDKRWLAYIFATAYRESAGTMQPVREGLCKTNQCSINAVTKLMVKNKRPKSENYAIPDENGRSYYGRGLVQITHKRNYLRVSQSLGWSDSLVTNPDLALDRDKAIAILIEGSVQGMFSKNKNGEWRKLSLYLNETKTDWLSARKIINPGSKRAHIPAKYAQKFYKCFS